MLDPFICERLRYAAHCYPCCLNGWLARRCRRVPHADSPAIGQSAPPEPVPLSPRGQKKSQTAMPGIRIKLSVCRAMSLTFLPSYRIEVSEALVRLHHC